MKTYGSYATVDDAYNDHRFLYSLKRYAESHLFRPDMAMDVVHDAFIKAIINANKPKNKKKRVSAFILRREVARAFRRANKKWGMIPMQEEE